MKSELKQQANARKLPNGFWRLIIIAVLIGNASMMVALSIGTPDWLAVSLPIAAVGLVGVLLEYRQRKSGKSDE